MIEVGKKAPAFTLKDASEEKVALKDLTGQWVVVYFYPKADTPGCTVQACEFTDSIRDFEKLDATVLGVSPDDPAALARFIAKHKLKVTLLSDPTHRVMETYAAWGEKVLYGKRSIGVKRSTVIVDPSGKVAHHWKSVKAKGHAEKVRQTLEALRDGQRPGRDGRAR